MHINFSSLTFVSLVSFLTSLKCYNTSHSSSTLVWDNILDVTVSDTATAYDAVSVTAWTYVIVN